MKKYVYMLFVMFGFAVTNVAVADTLSCVQRFVSSFDSEIGSNASLATYERIFARVEGGNVVTTDPRAQDGTTKLLAIVPVCDTQGFPNGMTDRDLIAIGGTNRIKVLYLNGVSPTRPEIVATQMRAASKALSDSGSSAAPTQWAINMTFARSSDDVSVEVN